MRISLKVILLMWLGLFAIIGGLLYNAYSKLRPETFIALLTEQVQRNIPGAKLNVGKVSYGFSLDFNLNLRDIHLRRSGKLLGSVAEVELKIPWWLLLSKKGNAQINLTKLDIYVDHSHTHGMKEKLLALDPVTNLIKVDVPVYLADAKFTLRAKEVSIKDIHNTRRYFMISKLLVREFQYGKNSAFEINIPISIKHKEAQYLSELWLFGDVTPEPSEWKLNYRGEFKTRDTTDKFQMEDLVIKGQASFMPSTLSIRADSNLLIERDVIGKTQLRAGQNDLSVDVQFTKLPLNYFSFIYEDIKNPYLDKLDGVAAGNVKFEKSFNHAVATVQGKILFDGNLSLTDKFFIPGKWQIGFQDSRWDTSFISPKGEASFFRRSSMDMKKNLMIQYTDELGFAGLDVSQILTSISPLSKFTGDLPPIYFNSSISFNKCVLGDKNFSGHFRYGHSPDMKFYQTDLKVDDSTFELGYADKSRQKSIEMDFNKFAFTPVYHFLSPYIAANEGTLTGKLQGQWSGDWDSGAWKVDIIGDHLNQLTGHIPQLINMTASFFDLDSKLTKQIGLNLAVKNNLLTLNSLMLQIQESVKITGSLSSEQKSVLTLSYPKNKKFKPVKKEVLEPYWMQKDET